MTKNILITGATAGIGKSTAKRIAALTKNQDVQLILASRNAQKAQSTKAELETLTKNPIRLVSIDFDSLASVALCAKELAKELDHIDVLINNAGLFAPKPDTTQDGFEKHIGVNFIAPVLFTEKLLPLLQSSPAPRIIHVSSAMHLAARGMNLDSFTGWQNYSAPRAYAQSKLGNLLYSNALAKRFSEHENMQHMTSNALHPGGVSSDIYRKLPWVAGKFMKAVSINANVPAKRIADMTLSAEWSGKNGNYTSVQTPAWRSKYAKDAVLAESLTQHTKGLVAEYL